MISFLFLTIPSSVTYDALQKPLQFPQDIFGVSNWVMKFPLTIYSGDLTQKHIFTEGRVDVLRCSTPNLEERWKYFVMTRANGSRYYCTAHIFYERSPILKKQRSAFGYYRKELQSYFEFYLPKCLILMSEQPYFKVQTNLIKIYRELRRGSQQICHEVNCFLYNQYEQLILQGKPEIWKTLDLKPEGKNIVCPIEVAFNYYIQACNSHKNQSSIYWDTQSKKQILHLYNLPSSSLYQLNYFFHLPISGKTLIVALSAILQEKKVIFTSYNQNSNVMLMETLLSMIKPLKWEFLYVPNLPFEMLEAANECFMPMIVGIHKKYFHHITDNTDKIIIHVDTNTFEGEENLLDLPINIKNYLNSIPIFTTNKPYLNWERDVRVCSILMMSELLSGMSYMTNSVGNKKKKQEKLFYDEFMNKLMMYQKFKEETYDTIYSQFSLLLRLSMARRKQFLYEKFDQLMVEQNHSVFFDNQKQWIQYYYNHNERRKKVKDLKQSILFDFCLSSTNHSEKTSKNTSSKKLKIGGGKKLNFHHSSVRL